MGPKTEKDLLPKVSREKRETVSNEVSRERSVLEGLVKVASLICIICFSVTARAIVEGDLVP